MVEAAALPETFFTVWTNLYERGDLKPGETLMVHGGTSGIGTTAIQVASRLGAKVIATAGSAEKCRACLDLGAARAVNYREEDFVEAAKDFTGGKGVDVILDMVGGDYIEKNLKSLNRDGRLVNIAFMKGAKAEINFMPLMLKRLTITGSTLRAQSVARKGAIAKAVRENVWPLIEKGEVKPVIYKTFSLEQAKEAHELMESNRHIGKIVFQVAE
jgi:putative PIG3 family NAD(P)H quinone oxidoreductase